LQDIELARSSQRVSQQLCNPSAGFTPASRRGSARLIAKCNGRHLRAYSKMKQPMTLAAGLPTIFSGSARYA